MTTKFLCLCGRRFEVTDFDSAATHVIEVHGAEVKQYDENDFERIEDAIEINGPYLSLIDEADQGDQLDFPISEAEMVEGEMKLNHGMLEAAVNGAVGERPLLQSMMSYFYEHFELIPELLLHAGEFANEPRAVAV